MNLITDGFNSFDQNCEKEWIVTNGIGGYASQSLTCTCTRSYHGLLVAAIGLPTNRIVTLAQVDEAITIGSVKYEFSTNQYGDVIHPQGFQYLKKFCRYPMPEWTFEFPSGVVLRKRIYMEKASNTVCIDYQLSGECESAVLDLVPLVTCRSYHNESYANSGSTPKRQGSADSCEFELTADLHLKLFCPGAEWRPSDCWYYNFKHQRETERGLADSCDLYCGGSFSVSIINGETVTLCATTDESFPDLSQSATSYLEHFQQLSSKSPIDTDFGRSLTFAADQFVIDHPKRKTVIAGYPWFTDWGRDTMIALPGLCLTTGRTEIAIEILESFARFLDNGMIPNRFPDGNEEPEYNTVDATLWFVRCLFQFSRVAPDKTAFVEKFYPCVKEIVHWHQVGTRYNIKVDPEDGLLSSGEEGVQLTWMDARVGDWVVTPRMGKPVEINALWFDTLMIAADFARELGEDPSELTASADKLATSFQQKFVRPDGLGLFDVISANGPGDHIRPNQIFALTTIHPLVSDKTRESVLSVVESELLTPFGLRTLSRLDPDYRSTYAGDQWHRDSAYHQGIVWPWLLGPFVEAHFDYFGDRSKALKMLGGLEQHLNSAGIGSISEIFDAETPYHPDGCFAQAWSVATVLHALKRVQNQ